MPVTECCMLPGQNDEKVHADPEIIGEAIEVHQSTCANSTIVIHLVDVGGNSRGTFEFDRTSQVFLDKILDDNLKLGHAGIPTGATLTVVVTTKTLSERVKGILSARQKQTPEAEPLNSDMSRFHDALYCFAMLPVVNDAFYVSGMWNYVFDWKLSHLVLLIDTLTSICGVALLKHMVWLNHEAPRGDCLCGCSCPAYTLLLLGICQLFGFLFSFYCVSTDVYPFNTEAMLESGQYRISVVATYALSSTTMLAFGSYWHKMNSRRFKMPNSGTSDTVGHIV